MRTTIGNLLLVLGTVLGAIAAANSAKVSRWLELEPGVAHEGEFVFADVGAGSDSDPLAAAGAPLDAALVDRLLAAGIDSVEVKDPPIDEEELDGSARELYLGRVLSKDLTLGTKSVTLKAGKRLTEPLLNRLGRAKALGVPIDVQGERQTVDLPDPDAKPPVSIAHFIGGELAEEYTFEEDDVIKEGSFLDEPRVERIVAAGVPSVAVAIQKEFSFASWEQRWLFLLSMAAMVGGIALKRSGGAGAALGDEGAVAPGSPGALGAELDGLLAGVKALAEEAEGLEVDVLHARIDALLTGPVQRLGDGRTAVQASLGAAGFVAVMGPLASAERYLNRGWSAAVDGNAEEAVTCVRDAVRPLGEARDAVPG